MSEVGKLTVNVRTGSGKGPAGKLRATGMVPGVCYGASKDGRVEPMSIIVNVKALRASLDPVRKQNTVIELTVADGDRTRVLSALVKDYQLDPVRREITHVDLLAIDPTKEVLAEVSLEFVGKAKGLTDGGQIRLALREVQIRAVPSNIPVKLPLDISALEIGDALHVSDIPLPAGVTMVTGRDQAVVSCMAPEAEEVVAAVVPDAAAAVAGAGVAAPAAAGAAPAAAGAAPAAGAKGAAPAAAAKAAPAKGDKGGKK